MKKVLVVALVVMLGVASLAVVGCGGDTDQAKEYMVAADAANDVLTVASDKLDKSTEAIIGAAISGDLSAVDATVVATVGSDIEALIAECDQVKEMYKNITSLEGVEDYVDYANNMIEYLTAQKATLSAGLEIFKQLSPAIQTWAETGDSSALTAAMGEAGPALEGLAELQKKADALFKSAVKIKVDKLQEVN
ncbi:MAG: hypothetical protein KKE79_04715 [Actinobacteria bacterium]|nr:hypothetical protein [Actinomycetota bacterium]MBU4301927.1 hypothetical protein [Actinomycetota bacterium]MBU4386319.1 hypothetical protein [Actinomycetota bacterium]MBU4489920.1 hypothetical protein [Actinomycetota bacterium]MCG2795806.1 hypothetical protein [Actinomycetes bacterium]